MEEERLGLETGILGGSDVAESELAKGYSSIIQQVLNKVQHQELEAGKENNKGSSNDTKQSDFQTCT